MSPPLPNGLLLVGGRSRRMLQDKATLEYGGQLQINRAYELLKPFCQKVYLSVRKDQKVSCGGQNTPLLEDVFENIGPLGGILTALTQHPRDAWLVVACDLPFLTESCLSYLLEERDPDAIATAYKSTYDGLPEPLCSIYEPRALGEMRGILEEKGQKCPRRILMQTKPKLLEPIELRALDNVNTPEEYQKAAGELAVKNS